MWTSAAPDIKSNREVLPSPSTSLRPDFRMLLESQATLVLLEKDPCPRAEVSSMTP